MISMSGKARPYQKTMKFLDGLKGDLPDEELAAISGTWRGEVAKRHR